MPTETYYLSAVIPVERFNRVTRETFPGWDLVTRCPGPTFLTHDPFAASLAKRAVDLQRPVSVTWRDIRHGKLLVTIDLAEEAGAA